MKKVLFAVAVLLTACGDGTETQLVQCKSQIMDKSREPLIATVRPELQPFVWQMLVAQLDTLPKTPEGLAKCLAMLAQK